jgi:hypothetical protein
VRAGVPRKPRHAGVAVGVAGDDLTGDERGSDLMDHVVFVRAGVPRKPRQAGEVGAFGERGGS